MNRLYKLVTLLTIILSLSGILRAQGVAINADNSAPDPSAMLQHKEHKQRYIDPFNVNNPAKRYY